MLQGKIIWLAVNPASGSNSEGTSRALDEAFGHAACAIARWIDFPEEGVPSLAELRRGGVDVLVVFAGDGTANALVTTLYGWEGAVLVLPGGTMNLLAHRLHGAAEPVEIVNRVAAGRGRRSRPTLVRSRCGDGLAGVVAGPGTEWNAVREAIRETDVLATIAGTAEAIGASAAGAKIVCREPGCGRAEGYSAILLTPRANGLEVEGYYAETITDYARQGVALLRRKFREGPHDLLGCYAAVQLACPEEGAMGLLIDGEPCKAGGEEHFVLARCEVDLLATTHGE